MLGSLGSRTCRLGLGVNDLQVASGGAVHISVNKATSFGSSVISIDGNIREIDCAVILNPHPLRRAARSVGGGRKRQRGWLVV